jgi:hypothetical protein
MAIRLAWSPRVRLAARLAAQDNRLLQEVMRRQTEAAAVAEAVKIHCL